MMVIQLSGVKFGLKEYAWFQNPTSAKREFDLKWQSMISDQNCTTRSSIATLGYSTSILRSRNLIAYIQEPVTGCQKAKSEMSLHLTLTICERHVNVM